MRDATAEQVEGSSRGRVAVIIQGTTLYALHPTTTLHPVSAYVRQAAVYCASSHHMISRVDYTHDRSQHRCYRRVQCNRTITARSLCSVGEMRRCVYVSVHNGMLLIMTPSDAAVAACLSSTVVDVRREAAEQQNVRE